MLDRQSAMVLADTMATLALPVVSVSKHVENGVQRGLWVVFANEMTLSIQWRDSSYSNVGRGFWEPGDEPDFECAAWYPERFDEMTKWGYPRHKWFNPIERFDGDDVMPYVKMSEIPEIARLVAAHVLPDVANFGKAIAMVARL